MRFDEIVPFVRYTRLHQIDEHTGYKQRVGYDCRFFYTVSGEGELKIRNTSRKMVAGDLMIIHAGVPYQPMSVIGKSAVYVTVNFDFTQQFATVKGPVQPVTPQCFLPEQIFGHESFEDTHLFDDFCAFSDMFRVGALAQQIALEDQRRLVGYRPKINGLMAEILAECLRASAAYSDTSQLKNVLDYLHRNYHLPLSNASIAERFGYHPNYLSSLFRNITGKSLYQYLQSIRIAKAMELLEMTNLPIAKIAEQVGFDSANNFSVAFRKATAITPSQCRENSRFV